jgi:hypothetical protein
MNDEVEQISPQDTDVDEVWSRQTDEPDVRGVEASRIDEIGGWVVDISVQEFFRQDQLGIELRQRAAAALRSVGGVASVGEADNESWFVTGTPSGKALAAAAATVVDDLAGRLRAAMTLPE